MNDLIKRSNNVADNQAFNEKIYPLTQEIQSLKIKCEEKTNEIKLYIKQIEHLKNEIHDYSLEKEKINKNRQEEKNKRNQ